jgi:hypothetical protein
VHAGRVRQDPVEVEQAGARLFRQTEHGETSLPVTEEFGSLYFTMLTIRRGHT